MIGGEGYGEEGYTVIGREHYTAQGGYSHLSRIFAFLLGGAVGAGIALLLTPQSGSKTRRQIREATRDVTEKASSYYDQVREKVDDVVSKGKDLVHERKPLLTAVIEAGKEAYEKEKEKRIKEQGNN